MRKAAALVLLCLVGSCTGQVLEADEGEVTIGTWGGENVALLVTEDVAHVHIACTLGDFPVPLELDDQQRFNVTGSYILRAYPVQLGPRLPAQFAGILEGARITFTVAVNDTVEKKLVALGPVTVTFGREPRMQACPICSMKVQKQRRPAIIGEDATIQNSPRRGFIFRRPPRHHLPADL